METLIKNCKIISPHYDENEFFDIHIKDAKFHKISKNLNIDGINPLDAKGLTVIPGLVDMNCNLCEPGFEHIEDIASASLSAARGGFTTITVAPNTKPCIDNKTVLQYLKYIADKSSIINIYPYGAMTLGCNGEEMAEFGEMIENGIVAISDGNKTVQNSLLLRNIFKYSLMFDIPIITHCEDKSLSCGDLNEGVVSTYLGLEANPRESEEIIVSRNLILNEHIGNHLHISSVTTKGSVQLIKEAKARGINVSCETSPQYFTLTEKEVLNYNAIAKINPPLRTEEDIEAIISGLKDGTIDAISSRHDPSSIESKEKEFGNASFGISNLETAFPVSYTALVENGHLSLSELVEKMSYAPAKILNLDKNEIKEGNTASCALINIDEKVIVESSLFYSKSKFSLYDKSALKGNIQYTIANGQLIF